MNFDQVFLPLANYFNFLIDFLSFGNMDSYLIHDTVSVLHVSDFLIGIVFMLLISRSELLFSKGKIEIDWRIMMFVPLMLGIAILWHFSVSIVSLFFRFQVGSFKDSFNVALGGGSVVLPYLASSKSLQSLPIWGRKSSSSKFVVSILELISLIVSSLVVINFFRFAGLYFKLILIQTLASSIILILSCLIVRKYLTALIRFIEKEKRLRSSHRMK